MNNSDMRKIIDVVKLHKFNCDFEVILERTSELCFYHPKFSDMIAVGTRRLAVPIHNHNNLNIFHNIANDIITEISMDLIKINTNYPSPKSYGYFLYDKWTMTDIRQSSLLRYGKCLECAEFDYISQYIPTWSV